MTDDFKIDDSGLILCLFSCVIFEKEDGYTDEPAQKKNVDGIRIAWDFRSLAKIAPADNQAPGYY